MWIYTQVSYLDTYPINHMYFYVNTIYAYAKLSDSKVGLSRFES